MNSDDPAMKETWSSIEQSNLPHPLGPLLESHVKEALDQALAARYVRSRLLAGDGHAVASDWIYIIQCGTHHRSSPPHADECNSNKQQASLAAD